jgi:hypothetical protein
MAQATPPPADASSADVTADWARPHLSQTVVVATAHGTVKGRLVSAGGPLLVVDVPNPEPWISPRRIRTPIAMADVRQVSVQKDDPIVDGAVIGASLIAACLRWGWCGQGFDGQHTGRDCSIAVAFGAVFGGGLDASRHGTQEIFRPPPAGAVESRPAFVISLRF